MSEHHCLKCGEPFFRGKSHRLVCGVCWPVDAASPIDWAAVPVPTRKGRTSETERDAEAGDGRSHEVA